MALELSEIQIPPLFRVVYKTIEIKYTGMLPPLNDFFKNNDFLSPK